MADPSTSPPLTRASVIEAHKLIKTYIHHTPVLTNASLTELASRPREAASLVGTPWEGRRPARPGKLNLWFKCENFQRVGAFKVRGAFHAIERLKRETGWLTGGGAQMGVVTHSSGNHAQALSLAARSNGIPAYIVMPTISAPSKIAATKGYGASVIFSGSTSVEREAVAAKVIEETGARLVPPYDHPDIVLGQGTVGLELQDDVEALMAGEAADRATGSSSPPTKKKGLDAILAPCGGGGLLSGVALSCEGTEIRVFGTEPSFQGADDAKRGYESGTRVESVSTLTIADGLRTPVGTVPWGIIYERKLVSGFYSVTETEIKDALRLVLERFKIVIEPSAAVPLAVALYNEEFRGMVEREGGGEGWDVGIVFSGGNVSLDALGKLFAGES
ncbi:tryptophan synthase beta subunit-like PLP-dependent enzyme [Pseudomassariella vexata]|uniref:Tryptophan synthase beta subunit-like PLP-dependent enzyme n=1 Tax=Pseudomassariella vexata TaxID=1141098 RepID=A0A1Y2EBQ8_9PEZI|nr:tryptophan synthase beta subunit-like PLP-dependent enzyme [Pseudomassariella vexata]ORY68744.1 tryptophan synthase beta subunit-like PLP-dependent enzyme [Pseudomassariella vexata]